MRLDDLKHLPVVSLNSLDSNPGIYEFAEITPAAAISSGRHKNYGALTEDAKKDPKIRKPISNIKEPESSLVYVIGLYPRDYFGETRSDLVFLNSRHKNRPVRLEEMEFLDVKYLYSYTPIQKITE